MSVVPLLPITIIFYFFLQDNARAQWASLDENTNSLVEHGIYQIHHENYKEALNTFEKLIHLHPNQPMGYFLVAVVYQIIMRNYRVKTFEQEFEKYLDLAIENGENAIHKNIENPLNYFF